MKTALESALFDLTALKRPRVPYTLYVETTRVIIPADLGRDEQEEAVEAEGEKRWQEMCEEDKRLWLDVYTTNIMHYNARTHAYRAGNLKAAEMCDREVKTFAEEHMVEPFPWRPTVPH